MAGNYYRPTPLDFTILGILPDKGVLGGVHWAGKPAKYLLTEINESLSADGKITSGDVQARLRSMRVAGFVEVFMGHGVNIWARTPEGVEFYKTREEVLGNG